MALTKSQLKLLVRIIGIVLFSVFLGNYLHYH